MPISHRVLLIASVALCYNTLSHPISKIRIFTATCCALQATTWATFLGLKGSEAAERGEHNTTPTETPLSPYYANLILEAQKKVGIPPAQCVLGTTLQGAGAPVGKYQNLTRSLHLNEEVLNTYPHGCRWMVCLHEATHRAQWLRPGYVRNLDSTAHEREADENALNLAQCHQCVREFASLKGAKNSAYGYVSSSDCKEYEERYVREGKICPHHHSESKVMRLMRTPINSLLRIALDARQGYEFLGRTTNRS